MPRVHVQNYRSQSVEKCPYQPRSQSCRSDWNIPSGNSYFCVFSAHYIYPSLPPPHLLLLPVCRSSVPLHPVEISSSVAVRHQSLSDWMCRHPEHRAAARVKAVSPLRTEHLTSQTLSGSVMSWTSTLLSSGRYNTF